MKQWNCFICGNQQRLMEAKCKCQNCSEHIAFPGEMSGQTVECPHCKMETILFVPQIDKSTSVKSVPAFQTSSSSYIQNNLMSGEKVMGTAALHWVVYLQVIPAAIVGLFIAVTIRGAMEGNSMKPISSISFLLILILVEIFVVGIVAFAAFINIKTSEFGVTNKRVLMKCGFIRRHSVETMIPKIESIVVSQGILGRLLNFGTIIVCGTGGTKDPFHKIANPLNFRQMIQVEIEKSGNQK